jgi:hypothetical protein
MEESGEEMKWISVHKRLPKIEGNYLVVYQYNENSIFDGVAEYSVGFYRTEHGTGWDNNSFKTFEITHWMSLPKPPETR